jgi:hypothetical protein
MGTENLEHQKDPWILPSEKIFTLQEIKEAAYSSILDRVIVLEKRKIQENIPPEVYKNELLRAYIYGFFGVLISQNPRSLGLPEKLLLPEWEKSWKDIPLEKSWEKISIESIVLGETRLLMNGQSLSNLKRYWETIQTIKLFIEKEIGDISKVKKIQLVQDDNEPFRIWLTWDSKDSVAKHGKRVTNILKVEYSDGSEKLINLLDQYRVMTSPKTEKERTTLAQIQKERKELRENMNREPLFWWSVSYEYALIGGAWTVAGILWTMRIVKSIRYRNDEGKMVDIKPASPIQWAKEQITWAINKELESWWMMYNSRTLSWENILDKARRWLLERLPHMTVSEMNARTGLGIHPSRWDNIQKNPEKFLSQTPYRDFIKKWMRGILNHGILFPLDVLLASEVATYSNSATVFSAWTDLAAFYLWQKSVDVVGRFIPGWLGRAVKLLKFPAGIATTMYGNKLWKEALEWNKKKWQYLFQDGFGSLYTNWQSASLNILSGGFVNYALDKAQEGKQSGEELHDVWSMAWVFSLFWKNFDIPEVNFFQHKIDLATDPGDWLRGQPGRTVDDWNNQITHHLPHNTLRIIWSLVERMKNGKYPFTPEKIKELKISKEDLLMQTLNTLLSGGNDPSKWPIDVKWNILLSVEKELKGWWKWEASMNKVTEVVYTQVPKLKIDSFFMEHYYPTQILFHQTHIGLMTAELGKYISKKEIEYVQTIQEKMEKNEPIADEGKWIKTEVLWMSSNKFIPSETNILFQGILDNKKPIKAVLDMNPKSKPTNTTVGEYFAYMLNFILEQKRRKEFFTQVQNGNTSWVKWSL